MHNHCPRERGPSAGYKTNPFLIFGLALALLGIVILLHNLDVIRAGEVLHYWPVILIAAGLAQLFQADGAAGRVGGFVITLAGTGLLLRNLDLLVIRIRDWWPLALVLVGGVIMWQAVAKREAGRRQVHGEDSLTGFAVFSGFTRACNSTAFRGGELTAIFGGCEVDLREAAIRDEAAVIRVFALFGGIEIRVPAAWTVVLEGAPILGGMEDATRPLRVPDVAPQRLIVRGCAIFGGVEVRN